jgi:Tfp pilus assembly protein PilV
MIAGVLGMVSLIAFAVASTVTLSQSIQTAHYVNHLAKNVSLTLISQEAIDKKIETRFNALESLVVLLGNEVQATKTDVSLCCHSSTNGFVSQLNLTMCLN